SEARRPLDTARSLIDVLHHALGKGCLGWDARVVVTTRSSPMPVVGTNTAEALVLQLGEVSIISNDNLTTIGRQGRHETLVVIRTGITQLVTHSFGLTLPNQIRQHEVHAFFFVLNQGSKSIPLFLAQTL